MLPHNIGPRSLRSEVIGLIAYFLPVTLLILALVWIFR